jgi:predicted subunit of tRNA(5-methylaminomethyl-2-thiouridylate) methyltransferase
MVQLQFSMQVAVAVVLFSVLLLLQVAKAVAVAVQHHQEMVQLERQIVVAAEVALIMQMMVLLNQPVQVEKVL